MGHQPTIESPHLGTPHGEIILQGGLDLGKQRDFSCLTIAEVHNLYMGQHLAGERPGYYDDENKWHAPSPVYRARFKRRYIIRHLERYALGTDYRDVCARVAEIFAESKHAPTPTQRYLYFDLSGVGQGVGETLKSSLKSSLASSDVLLHGVTLTYGRQEYDRGKQTVSKIALVSNLVRLLSKPEEQAELYDEVVIPPRLRTVVPLVEELRDYHERLAKETGNQSFEGSNGTHDDTVMSLALSLLCDPFKYRISYSQRVY